MKVVSVVGARPPFIKAAVLSRAVMPVAQKVLAQTGQHDDDNMSHIFFEELNIPQPEPEFLLFCPGQVGLDKLARFFCVPVRSCNSFTQEKLYECPHSSNC